MTRSGRPPLSVALLRCTSCRFTAIYFLPFFGALVGGGLGTISWAAFGCLLWFAHSTGTEAVNRLSDRREDGVNRPERTALCEQVGWGRVRIVALAAWALVGILDVGALSVRRSVPLAVLLVLGVVAAVGYSYGLRLGRRGYVSLFVLTFPFGGTFMIGWTLAHPILDAPALRDLVFLAGPLLVVAAASLATLAGVKDLTDVAGDEAAGYHSAWIRFLRTHRAPVVFAVVSAPYLLLVLLLAAGAVPARDWAVLALLPAVLALARCFTRSRSHTEHMAAREVFYLYWLALESVAMWCYAPQAQTVVAAGAAAVWWLLATRYLHWHAGIDRALLAAVRRLLTTWPPPALPASPADVPAGWKGTDGG